LEVTGEIYYPVEYSNVKYRNYIEGDKLTAKCAISSTKPPANLVWSVGKSKFLYY
jgi:hypothetical protein